MPLELTDGQRAAIGIAIPNVVGIGSQLIGGNPSSNIEVRKWWTSLHHSSLMPPDWAWSIVFPAMSTMAGYASYLVYRDGGGFGGKALVPLAVYDGMLVTQFLYGPIFFGKKNLKLSLLLGITGTACCAACVHLFKGISKTAGKLMIPVTLWSTFCTYLTWHMYAYNKNK